MRVELVIEFELPSETFRPTTPERFDQAAELARLFDVVSDTVARAGTALLRPTGVNIPRFRLGDGEWCWRFERRPS